MAHILQMRTLQPSGNCIRDTEENCKIMEHRKNVNTPHSTIDEETLLRLMREAEPVAATFSGNGRRDNKRRNSGGSCGCENSRRDTRYVERVPNDDMSRRYSRPSGGCGCGNAQNDMDDQNADCCKCKPGGEVQTDNSCTSCANDNKLKGLPLAMAYVPMQEWEDIYDDENALVHGTLFKALDLPWYQSSCRDGVGGKCNNER